MVSHGPTNKVKPFIFIMSWIGQPVFKVHVVHPRVQLPPLFKALSKCGCHGQVLQAK